MSTETPDRLRQRVVAMLCRHCGETFTPVRPHQRFCKPSCRWEHFKVARQPRLPGVEPDDLFAQPFE